MADRGTDLHAVSDGTVAFAGTARGFGKLVIIDHGRGYRTYYAHLAAIAKGLHTGDVLLRGDVLGLVGSTGRSTGPHLHFETRRGNDYIDPRDAARQLEFWVLSPEEQAWIAQQMLTRTPVVPASPDETVSTVPVDADVSQIEPLPEGLDSGFARVEVGGRPEPPASTVMVVATDGSATTHSARWTGDPAACRAYSQLLSPERPELPKPVVRKAVRKKAPMKKAPARKAAAKTIPTKRSL
jgi:hypothetical protein